MAVYICHKCGAVVEINRAPAASGCINGNHSWSKVSDGSLQAKPGLKPYQCKKCRTIIYAKKLPSSYLCSKGGNHIWVPL